MDLYIKQHIFTWGDRFSIYDEQGNEKYYVQGEVFTFGKKLHLCDASGNELAYIEQKLFSFLPKYRIYRDGYEAAEVVKEFTFFLHRYRVDAFGWNVNGDFTGHDYEVISGDRTVVSVSKKWFSLGDAYMISIDGVDEINALAVVLVIDACIDSQND